MTGRERILNACEFKPTDRVPMDLGGMLSTSISCFAYPKLVAALGLPPRRPRICDTGQMLALPDLDVLDALGCDCVTVLGDITNAFEQDEKWHNYDFNGRLDACVCNPAAFSVLADGTISQNSGDSLMPPESFVFTSPHAGQQIHLGGDIPRPDLDEMARQLDANPIPEEHVRAVADVCRRARESSERAVFFNGPGANLGIAGFGGIAVFPVLCLIDPEFVEDLHELVIQHAIRRMEAYLREIGPYIDVYMCCSDDWGTQSQTIAPPHVYERLFLPYYRRVTDAVHRVAPNVKTFLHSCGAVYDIIDMVVESGFDILNPVQWTAGGHSYREWKDKARGRIALWGGGVNTQATLPLGFVADVEREVKEIVAYMSDGSGYVFNGIHNILAEIAPEKVIAMYRAAAAAR